MDHHAVDDLRRRQHQETVEAEVPFTGATAPPGLLAADDNGAVVHTHLGCVVPHPLWDVPPGLLCQLLQFRLGQGGKFRCLLLLPLQLLLMLPDPLPVLLHKILDLSVRGPKGRTDHQSLRPELQAQGLPPAADQAVQPPEETGESFRAPRLLAPGNIPISP